MAWMADCYFCANEGTCDRCVARKAQAKLDAAIKAIGPRESDKADPSEPVTITVEPWKPQPLGATAQAIQARTDAAAEALRDWMDKELARVATGEAWEEYMADGQRGSVPPGTEFAYVASLGALQQQPYRCGTCGSHHVSRCEPDCPADAQRRASEVTRADSCPICHQETAALNNHLAEKHGWKTGSDSAGQVQGKEPETPESGKET